MAEQRKAAITIDVDSLRFYREIHGLEARRVNDDPIYDVALARFFDLLEDVRIPATLFLIAEDAAKHPQAFERVKTTGAEIASHSFAHDYRLTTRSRETIRDDLVRADRALSALAPGGKIAGFRAPGYNTSRDILETVLELGYAYDSSLLPSPLYFGARAIAIGTYQARGRPSQSLRGSWRAFAGPLAPYRADLDQPWRRAEGERGILELPMACEPLTRVPFFGTAWVLAGDHARSLLLRGALARLPYVNFEMHALDLLDASDPGVGADLAAAQRDLRVPAGEKIRAFRELFSALRDACHVDTLARIAETVKVA